MATADDYRRHAAMHERYLSECRVKRKTNASYGDMMPNIAADMHFCDRANLRFDADPNAMIAKLETDVAYFSNSRAGSDIDQTAYAKALARLMKSFMKKAEKGEHLVP